MNTKKIILLLLSFIILPESYCQIGANRSFATQLTNEANASKGQHIQSLAHLSSKYAQNEILKVSDLASYQNIIKQALKKEYELENNYFVFYTAVPYMRLFQDLTRLLYERKNGAKGALKEGAFQFIRYTYNNPVFDKYKTVNDFIIHELSSHGMINDNDTAIKTILVATNLALFGNMGLPVESTYTYFTHPQHWARAKKEWLIACLQSFGYSTKYADKLLDLSDFTKTDSGDLFQIFIPKYLVDQIGYLSWRQGIPFDINFIRILFNNPDIILDKRGKILSADINAALAAFKKGWQEKNPTVATLVNDLIHNTRRGKYKLSPLLEQYKNSPQTLSYLDLYQARILITNNYLLNPESGIKIYRYSTLDPKREVIYKTRLLQIINEMDKENDKKPLQKR